MAWFGRACRAFVTCWVLAVIAPRNFFMVYFLLAIALSTLERSQLTISFLCTAHKETEIELPLPCLCICHSAQAGMHSSYPQPSVCNRKFERTLFRPHRHAVKNAMVHEVHTRPWLIGTITHNNTEQSNHKHTQQR